MMLSKLLPLVVMGGIAAHSGGAIKERIQGMVGARDALVTKQRMMTIMEAATIATASGDTPNLKSQKAFRKFAKRAIRLRGKGKADTSLDFWGTPLRGRLRGATLTITSAGGDKRFGNEDDIRVSRNIFDY